jgi:hypothetical protein
MKFLSALLLPTLLILEPTLAKAAPSQQILKLELRTDLEKVAAKPTVSDDEDLEGDSKAPMIEGTLRDLAHPERTFRIQVRARGNTSRAQGEADFPKLKVELEKKEELKGTAFDGNRSFRINTHLSDTKKTTGMGRIAGDAAPMRETLAYRLADLLDLATPNARLAEIHYIDTKTAKSFTRHAMLLESTKRIGKRLGGKEIDELTLGQDESTKIDPVLGAKFFLFHKLISNNDVQLRVNEEPTMSTEINRAIWNSFVFEMPNGSRVPVVYDLDLAGMVNGRSQKFKKAYPEFGLTAPGSRDLAERLAPLFEKFTKAHLSTAFNQMLAKKSALELAVEEATIDDEGRALAKSALDRFFSSLEKILALKVIAAENVRFFNDSSLTIDKLRKDINQAEELGSLRKGTPVRVLERMGQVLKVEIIPIKNVLKEKESAIGYIRADTPIVDSLTEDQIRKFDARDMSL